LINNDFVGELVKDLDLDLDGQNLDDLINQIGGGGSSNAHEEQKRKEEEEKKQQ
jgi:hypothetical protein